MRKCAGISIKPIIGYFQGNILIKLQHDCLTKRQKENFNLP